MLTGELAALGSLALSAFPAAPVRRAGPGAVPAGGLALHPDLAPAAVLTATVANTAGGMSTYLLGRLLPRKETPPRLAMVARWGSVTLLLSWVPLLGDALCAAAGVLRLNWLACLLWMGAGKGLRYLAIAWAMQ